MKRAFHFCLTCLRATGGVIGLFLLWTLWLALGLLLVVQLYIASANELALPDFVLRRLESRLAESGLRATFARTSFDPGGRVLIEGARIGLPAYEEPIAVVRSVYVQLNPWMLAVGQVEPDQVRVTGATISLPAMLSPTGQPEQLVSELDATFQPGDKLFTLDQLSARIAGVAVSARGTVQLPRRTAGATPPDLGALAARHFPTFARFAREVADQVSRFDQPSVFLELAPSTSGATSVTATVLARTFRWDEPVPLLARELRARTRLLLLEDTPTSWIEVSASELRIRDDLVLRGVQGDVYGRLGGRRMDFEPREIALTADEVTFQGLTARAVAAQLVPRPFPQLDLAATARVLDAPLELHGSADVRAGRAGVTLAGELAPAVIDVLGQRLRANVRRFFSYEWLQIERAQVRIDEGWRFQHLAAHVRLDGIDAFGVPMTDGRAVIELDPGRFYAPEAFARVGENFAAGSYEHDLATHAHRFLLAGRLRPLTLSPWFRDWWPRFFQQLEFPAAPPDANVDVQGVWRQGHRTNLFIAAHAVKPVIRGAEFDQASARLFIRPGFFDGLQLHGTRPEGETRGRFTYHLNPQEGGFDSLDLAFQSNLDLEIPTRIVGPLLERILEPIQVSGPPTVSVSGRFTSASSPEGAHRRLLVDARTRGGFRFHHFPLQDVSFRARLDDDDLLFEDVEAIFATGVVGGRAQVTGLSDAKRLGFDLQLRDASLGQAAAALQSFLARQRGEPPPPPGKFVQEKANVRMDLAASAEGRFDQPFSFQGSGHATLQGPGIGEVALLGALSELLRFTALRITSAQANLRIEGARLAFPEVKLRGSNSAIDAHGHYALDRRELDFNAKIFPFQESDNLLQSVVGAVLTPLSNALEVKLTGSLDQPEWAFVIGPTNFLRSITPGEAETKPAPPADGNGEPTAPPSAETAPPAGG